MKTAVSAVRAVSSWIRTPSRALAGGHEHAFPASRADEPVPQRVGDKDVLAANVGDDAHRRLELSLHMGRRGRQLRGQKGAPAPDDEPRRAARGVDEAQEVVALRAAQ